MATLNGDQILANVFDEDDNTLSPRRLLRDTAECY